MYTAIINTIKYFTSLRVFLEIILLILAFFVLYIAWDICSKFMHKKKRNKYRKLEFSMYKDIAANYENYKFYIPYGVDNALAIFNSEVPHLLEVVNACIENHQRTIGASNNNAYLFEAFTSIETKLTAIVAASGVNISQRCRFYCTNSSKSFKIHPSSELLREYTINADNVYYQFQKLKTEEFKSAEVTKISNTMYTVFFELFELINNLVYVTKVKSSEHAQNTTSINDNKEELLR